MSNSHNNTKNFVIVLAAGASTRMGTCKALLPWLGRRTLLSYQLEQFLLAETTPIVVLGPHNADRQKDCLPNSWVVINPQPSRGKTSSILTALAVVPKDFEVLAISAVDQPRSAEVYRTLLQEHKRYGEMITAPVYKGRLGHPLLFSRKCLPELENITEETSGLRHVVQKYYSHIQKVEFDTSAVLTDLNTPESYQAELGDNS